ncbi:Ribosomal RNA large subunit methyltransferase N RlmN [Helicobacter ailurogastricus]|uniref:23S rRNA (adenine(2503)-C(2))-methyltransferase RlmN n=1 Tax=Helicobacter ailurogastricus TaxID=1578720 RepID=UPI001F164F2C|nr:23S rRNA (adenine(2503)-C(2))-methyltransferase RlmN [Helicobacter ailurogastricus]GMB90608.1 Ribosomal RNA large subunit methyltransferase N RlmN [Helicobacter ailurogastricus]GMB92103.1 Ribosomal RNA large subunit methyltransferase N RlmN [Helicobacter ailurogastricus]
MRSLYDLSLKDLQDYALSQGFKPFVAKQLFSWLYHRYATSTTGMHNLSKAFRACLDRDFCVQTLSVGAKECSTDKSEKYLFITPDRHSFESVFMVMKPTQLDKDGQILAQEKLTFCLSSQIGCKVGCVFCATARGGFVRDLKAGEIVEQVVTLKREHNLEPTKGINLVFMGMGEPLHNFNEVVKAIGILSDPHGLNISTRRITISTSGVVPVIDALGALDLGVQLAISLHAVNDALRSKLMPINKTYNLEALIQAIKRFPIDTRKRVMFEYLVIKDCNDGLEHAKALLRLLNGLKAKVNLIPYNPNPSLKFERPDLDKVAQFADFLNQKGLLCTLRISKGLDISAACGQLREKKQGLAISAV